MLVRNTDAAHAFIVCFSRVQGQMSLIKPDVEDLSVLVDLHRLEVLECALHRLCHIVKLCHFLKVFSLDLLEFDFDS